MISRILFPSLLLLAIACGKKEKTLEQLAASGHPVAQYELGRQFYFGDNGRPRDLLMAYQWFVRAAEAGDTGAQNTLGVMYQQGQGIMVDLKLAHHWYHQAANAGHAQAQSNLGHLCAQGIGVEKDIVEAYQWFALAAAGGDELGKANLEVVKRFMTPTQLEEGRARVVAWRKRHQ